jgi:hypothetical protein
MRLQRKDFLKLLFLVEFVALILVSLSLRRDYQDSWILEGLEFQFVAFMLTYVACFFSENRPKWLTVIACMYIFLAALLPSLKYVWYQGVAIDENAHYELAKTIYQESNIPAGRTYSDTPLIHLAIAIFSMVTNLSITDSFKIFPVLCWVSYPILIYALAGKLFPPKSSSISKYALLISSIPIATTSYLVIGLTYGALLVCFALSQAASLLKTHDRKRWVVTVFFLFSLVVAHSYSSIILLILFGLIFLVATPILKKTKIKSLEFAGNVDTRIFTRLTLISLALNSAWLCLKAENLLRDLTSVVTTYFYKMMGILVTPKEVIPPRFFELSFLDQLRIVFVYNGADLLLISLSLIGLFVSVRKLGDVRFRKTLAFLGLYFLSMLVLLVLQVFFRFGELEYYRIVYLVLIVCPIFSAIALSYIENALSRTKKFVKIAVPLLMTLMLAFAIVEFYKFQPIVPSVRVDVNGISSNEPVAEINDVNSAYQRYMIYHTEKYISKGKIASDRTTLNQIIGLNYSLYRQLVVWYYPYSKLVYANITEREYDYFLIHLPGKSGVLSQPAEIRSANLIISGLGESNVLYNNGESFVCGKPFMMNASID